MGYRPLLNIYDLIDRVLDKGIVIDANVSIALVGIAKDFREHNNIWDTV
jgi:hypothetical protein